MDQIKSEEQIDDLWKRFKDNGDIEAKNELLLYYNYLVKWVVRRMVPKFENYTNYNDHLSYGTMGLIEAIDTYYNLEYDVSFKAYALTRIRGTIIDQVKLQDWASPNHRKEIIEINTLYEAPENKNANFPVDRQVTDSPGVPIEQVHKMLSQQICTT